MNRLKEVTNKFINENLVELSSEILEWKSTGLLHNGTEGKLRELAELIKNEFKSLTFGDCLGIAETKVYDKALEYVIHISKYNKINDEIMKSSIIDT